jgi:predicted anti-sigma-YlaC factor YlaD
MKRTCKKVRKKLLAFLNNQLDKEKAKTIEQHLRTCLTCRKEEEALRSTWNLLEKYTIDKGFPDLSHVILERIEGEE